jgi:hypothetical protein
MDVLCTVSFQKVMCSNHVTVQISRHGKRKKQEKKKQKWNGKEHMKLARKLQSEN